MLGGGRRGEQDERGKRDQQAHQNLTLMPAMAVSGIPSWGMAVALTVDPSNDVSVVAGRQVLDVGQVLDTAIDVDVLGGRPAHAEVDQGGAVVQLRVTGVVPVLREGLHRGREDQVLDRPPFDAGREHVVRHLAELHAGAHQRRIGRAGEIGHGVGEASDQPELLERLPGRDQLEALEGGVADVLVLPHRREGGAEPRRRDEGRGAGRVGVAHRHEVDEVVQVVVEVGARQGEALPLEVEADLLAEVGHRLQVGIDRREGRAAGEAPVHLVHARRGEVAVDRAAQRQLVAGVELQADARIEARGAGVGHHVQGAGVLGEHAGIHRLPEIAAHADGDVDRHAGEAVRALAEHALQAVLAVDDEGRGLRRRAGIEAVVVGDERAARIDADLDVAQGTEVRLVEDRAALVGVGRGLDLADELVGRVDVVQRVGCRSPR